MWYIIIVISLIGIVFGTYSGNLKNRHINISEKDVSTGDTTKCIYTRSEIREKLEALANTTGPIELKPGAMCYMPAPTKDEDSVVYICPKCSEKTLYPGTNGWNINHYVSMSRILANSIPSINLQLDESQLCKKCSPDIIQPKLYITYKLEDDTAETLVCEINNEDLEIMKEFMQGTDKHMAGQGREVPLKDYLPRLQQLFGIKIESENK